MLFFTFIYCEFSKAVKGKLEWNGERRFWYQAKRYQEYMKPYLLLLIQTTLCVDVTDTITVPDIGNITVPLPHIDMN